MSGTPQYYQYEDINNAVVGLFRDAKKSNTGRETGLDVGCGRARLGQEIENLGFSVTGIENSPLACETARGRITEVIPHSLMDFDAIETSLADRKFDWILMADVLEHLPDPLGTLERYLYSLKPGGRVIISLPNFAVWDNRMRVLFGRFDYTDSGVLDRTHLRFFTFRSAKRMVTEAGLSIERVTLEPGIVRAFIPLLKGLIGGKRSGDDPGAILDSPAYKLYERAVMPIENLVARLLPGLLAFRVVIVAHR